MTATWSFMSIMSSSFLLDFFSFFDFPGEDGLFFYLSIGDITLGIITDSLHSDLWLIERRTLSPRVWMCLGDISLLGASIIEPFFDLKLRPIFANLERLSGLYDDSREEEVSSLLDDNTLFWLCPDMWDRYPRVIPAFLSRLLAFSAPPLSLPKFTFLSIFDLPSARSYSNNSWYGCFIFYSWSRSWNSCRSILILSLFSSPGHLQSRS